MGLVEEVESLFEQVPWLQSAAVDPTIQCLGSCSSVETVRQQYLALSNLKFEGLSCKLWPAEIAVEYAVRNFPRNRFGFGSVVR